MKTKSRFYPALYLALMGLAPCAQALLTTGYIEGYVGFDNIATKTAVNTHDMSNCIILGYHQATPADTKCSLFSTWQVPVDPIPGWQYLMTVESQGGVTYSVSASMYLFDAQGSGTYDYAPKTVTVPEKATVRQDFVECAGLIDFELGTNAACTQASYADKLTLKTLAPARSATKRISTPVTKTLFVVPDMGVTYDLEYTLISGTDPFSNLIQVIAETPVTPTCNKVTPVCIDFPGGALDAGGTGSGPVGDPSKLGEIQGQWDIVGEFEAARHRELTLVRAYDGLYKNQRLDSIPGHATQPSATIGLNPPWQLENLLPGDYKLGGVSMVRNRRASNVVVPESLGELGRPLQITAVANKITSLPGDPFVMTPGFFSGAILLQDPFTVTNTAAYSGLRYLTYNADTVDVDGIPVYPFIGSYRMGSFVGAIANNGVNLARSVYNDRCPDTTRTDLGCSQSAWPSKFIKDDPNLFGDMSTFDGNLGMLKSNYELVIANANIQGNQTRFWQANRIQLVINTPPDTTDPSNPNNLPPIRPSMLNITENLALPVAVGPGDHLIQDFKYCFGQVTVGPSVFTATEGTLYEPQAAVVGQFKGTNFLSQTANYQVQGLFYGTPPNFASKRTSGSVILTLPEGQNYVITPTVQAVSATGSISSTTFVTATVDALSCGQRVECALGLCLSVTLPKCAPANGQVNLSGSVNSNGANVSRIYYTVNGGPQIVICSGNCGVDPTFSASVVGLVDRSSNTIVVFADSLNKTASTTSQVDWNTPQCTLACDVDRDGDIDKLDLSAISRARGQTPLPGDPRDANGDGTISPADVKACIPKCRRPNCAP